MKFSVRMRLVLASSLAVAVLSVATVVYTVFSFQHTITQLNRLDYQERIRTIEFDYGSVDAVSGASDMVFQAREEILSRLDKRYSRADGSAFPFIINGSGEVVLHVEQHGIGRDLFSADLTARIAAVGTGDFSIDYQGASYWIIFSYYPEWDWYTGYILPNSERLAAVRGFAVRLSGVLFAGTALIVFLMILMLSRIIHPLRTISQVLRRVADGELSRSVTYSRKDEIGEIAHSFRVFQRRLVDIVTGIQSTSADNLEAESLLADRAARHLSTMNEIAGSTSAIRDRIGELNESVGTFGQAVEAVLKIITLLNTKTDEQLNAVNGSTASVEEMTASLDNVAAITRTKRESTLRLLQTAENGGEKVDDTVRAIADIHGNIDNIADMIELIQGIASQTNLLSMNAAIEAAHAGEAGRGFSVVADEIRKLAEESGENSAKITSIINTIIGKIENADTVGREAQNAFSEINLEVREVSDSFDEISASTEQLTAGTGEILQAMSVLNEISAEVRKVSSTASEDSRRVEGALGSISGIVQSVMRNIEQIDGETRQSRNVMEEIMKLVDGLKESMESLYERANEFTVERQDGPQS